MTEKGFIKLQLFADNNFSNQISRGNAAALIPEEISREIIQGVVARSATLSLFTRLRNMSSNVLSMPVLDLLPLAYFINGDTGHKQTSKVVWDKKYIFAEEIAVIVPIAENVLNDAADSGYDIWGEIRPRIEEAFGGVIDGAVIFGLNKPQSWRASIIDTARNAGAKVAQTDNLPTDILSETGLITKVETSGYLPNGVISAITMRGRLRGLQDTTGRQLYQDGIKGTAAPYTLDGMPMHFLTNGAWDEKKTEMIIGDMSQAVYSIRQDMTYKVLTEAIITDPVTKEIVFNLAQQDMVALRVVMRLGWEIPNPINALAPDASKRCPFAILEPKAAATTRTVTFTVMNAGETPTPVENARVILSGMTRFTNAAGQAVFNVIDGDYVYAVTKEGVKKRPTGMITVNGAAINVAVNAFA